MHYYGISVVGGCEEKFRLKAQQRLGITERIVIFKKKMRLKNGKEYEQLLFPGYAFLETCSEIDWGKFRGIDGFCRFLPDTKNARALDGRDLKIVLSLLEFGTVMDEVPVQFDKDDRIVILDGPFKSMEGYVTAVNRRNRRVNIRIEFMNGVQVVGLSYKVIAKA